MKSTERKTPLPRSTRPWAVIMAGGRGERFWPVGRAERTTAFPSASVPRQRTVDFSGRFVFSSSIQLPSSGFSCGPPKHQPLPVVRSTPIPFSFARRTASPNAFIHAGERSGLSAGVSLTE